MIPPEAIDSCRDLLIALLELANGDPAPRRHAAYVYHCYLHALRAGDSVDRRTFRWRRFIGALRAHLEFVGTSHDDAFLRSIIAENADLLPSLAVAV